MKPDLSHVAREYAERLTRTQRDAILLLHLTEPVRQTGSGVPGGTFKALRNHSLVRSGPSEREWFLTELGAEVQAKVREMEGLRPLEEPDR